MLDVMKTPPPVIAQITWTASRVRLPDDGKTVLVYHPEDEEEPVWMGWWDSATETWLSLDGYPMGMVTWWADVPEPPVEPKPGQVGSPSQLVGVTMDDAINLVKHSDDMPRVTTHHLRWIVHYLLKQLGLAALGGRTISIDLANGHSLLVQVRADAEVQG